MSSKTVSTGIFQQIDQALNRYYQSVGISDYLNADGIGKFMEFINENEMDEDDIEDELEDAENCQYTEFDPGFPYNGDEQTKEKFIFDLIKKCYQNANITFNNKYDESKPGSIPKTEEKRFLEDNNDKYNEEYPKIKKACDAFNRYYKSLNKSYNSEFSHFCDDNDLDDNCISDELMVEPSESVLVGFDPNFPFDKELQKANKEEKQQFIFDLIRVCYNNPNDAFFSKGIPHFLFSKSTTKHLFDIELKDIETFQRIYQCQCPVIWSQALEQDRSFMYILSVGRKYHFDYLQHLVDGFFRERIKHINSSYNELNWFNNNKHIQSIKGIRIDTKTIEKAMKGDKMSYEQEYSGYIPTEADQMALNTVQTFNKRCCPKLNFTNLTFINDSLEITVRYIDAAIQFIQNLINQSFLSYDTPIYPFQFDFCIGYDETINESTHIPVYLHDSDDDDIFRVAADDSDTESIDEKKTEMDWIGNIEAKLKHNRLTYVKCSNYEYIVSRNFRDLMDKLKKKYNLDSTKENYYYPYKRRFVIFVDRRKELKKTNNNKHIADEIYLYEPPSNCCKIPYNEVPEWYINSTKTCLLPNMKYSQMDKRYETEDRNIGSTAHCNGKLLTLSFHVREHNVIKCYLYWNGEMTRFMPEDIKTVLPKIFNMSWNNDANQLFIDNKQDKLNVNHLIEKMNKVIIDENFNAFHAWCYT